jgi:hypothetical protein
MVYCFLKALLISIIQKNKVVIWLYDNIEMRIEGRIIVRRISLPQPSELTED